MEFKQMALSDLHNCATNLFYIINYYLENLDIIL